MIIFLGIFAYLLLGLVTAWWGYEMAIVDMVSIPGWIGWTLLFPITLFLIVEDFVDSLTRNKSEMI